MLRYVKKAALIMAAAVTAVMICACAQQKTAEVETPEIPEVTGEFKTTVLKTGKSDAIILESESSTIVIDCGEKNDGDKVVEYLQANGIESIDYLFITHFDQDHVGGAAEVIESISIGQIIAPDYDGTNSEYTNFITAAANAGEDITRLTENMAVTFDDVLYEIYPAQKSYYAEGDNDYSIVIKATHGDDTFLFTGDAEEERIKELYTQLDLSADFLKMPHHGRIDSETAQLVSEVSPQYAVITCSKKEGADDEVLEILETAGIETYLTREGVVTAVSSGSGITVTQTAE